MAVFTPVAPAQAQQFLGAYVEGDLISLDAIAEGVENTNYRITTGAGRTLVLTLFEKRIRREDLPFCLGLTEHLAARGFATPTPVRDRSGELIGDLNDRPAALVRWADGAWPRLPTVQQAELAGAVLADLHLKGRDFPLLRTNPVGPACWAQLRDRCATAPQVGSGEGEEAVMLDAFTQELAWLDDRLPTGLPTGPIHADYFPDNVLFEDEEVSGVIDFYFACTGAFAYDVAIALNAWAFTKPGQFRAEIAQAFLAAYEARRSLSPPERNALQVLCRAAAVRFGLTRLHDLLFHPEGALVTPKDPRDYLERLTFFRSARSADVFQHRREHGLVDG